MLDPPAVTRRVLSPPPARTLDDAVRLCDPYAPLHPTEDSALRANLDVIRGGDRFERVIRNIRRSGSTSTLHFVSGHLGSGKTTELLSMQERLSRMPPANHTVFYVDVDRVLDLRSVDLEDILVALWGAVFEKSSRAAAKVLAEIWKSQIRSILTEFVVNLPEAVPDAVSSVLSQLRLPALEQRKKVRTALGTVISALVSGLNKALSKAKSSPDDYVVMILDNLEKIGEAQREDVEHLYLNRFRALRDLDAHLVIPVPLYLCHASAGASLTGLYGGAVVVLPMVKVRRRVAEGEGDDEGGLQAMTDLLAKRVAFDELFEHGRAAATDIARLSGGSVRHALQLASSAINEHDNPPVSSASIERAAGLIQGHFDRALEEPLVPILHALARSNRFPDNCSPEAKRDLLQHLFVLEYQDGSPDPWYAVHPLVERCRKYREYAP